MYVAASRCDRAARYRGLDPSLGPHLPKLTSVASLFQATGELQWDKSQTQRQFGAQSRRLRPGEENRQK